MIRRRPRTLAAALALVLTTACVDRETPLSPTLEPGDEHPSPRSEEIAHIRCEVVLAETSVECTPVEPTAGSSGGPSLDRILGGQDTYVKLTSSGTSYDGGTEILQTNVTLQNLLAQSIGTTDGSTVLGSKVFFVEGPSVTSGTGSVSVANPDGSDTFTATNQAYYHFNQILESYQISGAKNWQFSVESTVGSFTFLVYVSAPVQDDDTLLDAVWDGGWDDDWGTMGNWKNSVMPDSMSTVSVPSDSMFAGVMPVLAASDTIMNLRVGAGSSLDLGANQLEVRGNADAVGSVGNGTIRMMGSSALLRGTVNALIVEGSTALQGSAKTTGPLSVTGNLTTGGHPLTIAIPATSAY